MTEEQIEILKKALSLYRFTLAMQESCDMERMNFAEMLEELSKLVGSDVSYWSLYN